VHAEADVIAAAQRGSVQALDGLYRCYWPIAWQWAYALTGNRDRADDLAQEAFVGAIRSLPRFDPERPFRPWLKRIVVNTGIDELRRLRRRELPLDWFDDREPADEAAREASDDLVRAVRALAPSRRVVVVLHYWLDLPVDEIAALLNVPYGTAASRLSRALADLRATLEREHV
jgi:RNA polymerase sigma-70 factor (ECF subfamily)